MINYCWQHPGSKSAYICPWPWSSVAEQFFTAPGPGSPLEKYLHRNTEIEEDMARPLKGLPWIHKSHMSPVRRAFKLCWWMNPDLDIFQILNPGPEVPKTDNSSSRCLAWTTLAPYGPSKMLLQRFLKSIVCNIGDFQEVVSGYRCINNNEYVSKGHRQDGSEDI